MTARRPADIAADLRRYDADLLVVRERLADELDAHAANHVCVPKDRWPTADEIAEARDLVGHWQRAADIPEFRHAKGVASILAAFLDRLDPQADDVDPWALLERLVVPTLMATDLVELRDTARAALDARGQS